MMKLKEVVLHGTSKMWLVLIDAVILVKLNKLYFIFLIIFFA